MIENLEQIEEFKKKERDQLSEIPIINKKLSCIGNRLIQLEERCFLLEQSIQAFKGYATEEAQKRTKKEIYHYTVYNLRNNLRESKTDIAKELIKALNKGGDIEWM